VTCFPLLQQQGWDLLLLCCGEDISQERTIEEASTHRSVVRCKIRSQNELIVSFEYFVASWIRDIQHVAVTKPTPERASQKPLQLNARHECSKMQSKQVEGLDVCLMPDGGEDKTTHML
jgi:hypothetical protein